MGKTRESVAAYLASNPRATVRAVQAACGLSSPSVAQHHIKSLEREHAVQQDWYDRGYRAAREAETTATDALREEVDVLRNLQRRTLEFLVLHRRDDAKFRQTLYENGLSVEQIEDVIHGRFGPKAASATPAPRVPA